MASAMAGPTTRRLFGIDQQPQETRCRLRDGVECGTIAVRAVIAEARDRGINQCRIDRLQARRRSTFILSATPGRKFWMKTSAFQDQLVEHRKIFRLARIDCDAPLVAVVGLEMRAIETAVESRNGSPYLAARS